MKVINIFFLIVFTTLLFASCKKNVKTEDETLLAEVGEYTLNKSQVIDIMPSNLNGKDSITFIKTYVDNWVRSKLLYQIATSKISDSDGSLEEQVDRFREDLYINKFEQLFSQQKLDTVLTQTEIDAYYNKHKQDYILMYDVVKPVFVVLEKNKVSAKLKKQFLSSDPDMFDIFKDFTFENSSKFYFGNQWIAFDLLKQEIPTSLSESISISDSKGKILEDSTSYYFIKITSQITAGSQKPKELAYEEIAKILLHKRKIELLKSMRNKVYQDALHKEQFEVYY
jgi:hypothetical protein